MRQPSGLTLQEQTYCALKCCKFQAAKVDMPGHVCTFRGTSEMTASSFTCMVLKRTKWCSL